MYYFLKNNNEIANLLETHNLDQAPKNFAWVISLNSNKQCEGSIL